MWRTGERRSSGRTENGRELGECGEQANARALGEQRMGEYWENVSAPASSPPLFEFCSESMFSCPEAGTLLFLVFTVCLGPFSESQSSVLPPSPVLDLQDGENEYYY